MENIFLRLIINYYQFLIDNDWEKLRTGLKIEWITFALYNPLLI